MQLKKVKQFLSIKAKQAIGYIWKSRQQERKIFIHREGLFRSCSDLPFDIFIACSEHGQYEKLIRQGTFTQADLIEAWSNIQLEYIDLIEEPETLYIAHLERDIRILHHRISTVETTCYLLGIVYDERLVDCLKDFGYNYDFSPTDKKKNENSLGAISNRLSKPRLDLEMKSAEYTELTKNRTGNEKPTEKYFKSLLSKLAKFQGQTIIRPKDIMTDEFCLLFREYVEDYNQQKKAIEHGSKRHY